MELFNLLAKLTLDTSEYDRSLDSAQRDAESFEAPEEQKLELDNSEYTGSLNEAETESSIFSGSVGSIFSELKSVLVGLGIAAVVGGIVTQLKEGVELAKNHGDTIDKQSKKMGISAKAYQEWSYALELSGANITDLNRGLRTWQQSIGDNEQMEKLKGAFTELGIDADEAFKKIEQGENLDALLSQTMYALADMEPGQRGRIAEMLFGRSANELNPLFENTSKQIREMTQEASDLGMIMSDQEVENAAKYNDATTRLQGALNGIKEAFAADVIPLLTDAANTIASIVAFFNPRLKNQTLSEMLIDKDDKFAEQIVTIEGTAAAAETLADKLLQMGDTSKMTAEQYAIWKGTAEELFALVPSLSEVINTETGDINANSKEIKENIKQWERLAKQKALQTLKEEKLAAINEKNKDLIDASVKANKEAANAEKYRGESLDKVNAVLEKYGFGTLNQNATLQDVLNAQSNAVLNYDGSEDNKAMLSAELASAASEYTKAEGAAIQAQAEVDKLTKEIEEGKQEYEDWLAAADRLYGDLNGDADGATTAVRDLKKELDSLPGKKTIELTMQRAMRYAIGSAYIPYDQIALLHRGEQVLTATEARQNRGGADNSALLGALQGVRNDLQNLKLVVGRKTFGRAVVDYGGGRMNDYIGESDSRLASGYGT